MYTELKDEEKTVGKLVGVEESFMLCGTYIQRSSKNNFVTEKQVSSLLLFFKITYSGYNYFLQFGIYRKIHI